MKKLLLIVCLLIVPFALVSCAMPFFAFNNMQRAITQSQYDSEVTDPIYYDSYTDSEYSDNSYDSGYENGYNDGYADGHDATLSAGEQKMNKDSSTIEYTMPTVPVTFSLPDSFIVSPVENPTPNGRNGEMYEVLDPANSIYFDFMSDQTAATEAIHDFSAADDQALWNFLQEDINAMLATPDSSIVMSDYGIARLGPITYIYMSFASDNLYIDQYYTVKNGVMALFEVYSFDKVPDPAARQTLRDIVRSAVYA